MKTLMMGLSSISSQLRLISRNREPKKKKCQKKSVVIKTLSRNLRREILKKIHRSNHVLDVKTKDEAMSLAITMVPDKYFKDLTPKESREDSSVDSWERWMMKQEDSGDEKDNDAIIHFFEKKIYELVQRINCLRDMSKPETKTFVRLWNNSWKMIMGPDGKMKNIRGLGYESNDDS
jgi:hypothetical protein